MKKGLIAAIVIVVASGSASTASADIRVDIDSSNGNPITTQSGFTSFNAGSTAAEAQTVAPLTVDGVTFMKKKPHSACVFCGSEQKLGEHRGRSVCRSCIRELARA